MATIITQEQTGKKVSYTKSEQELNSCCYGRPFGHNTHEPKSGETTSKTRRQAFKYSNQGRKGRELKRQKRAKCDTGETQLHPCADE